MRKRLVLAAVLLLLGASVAGAAPTVPRAPAFARANTYRVGGTPVSLATGDLNGDGKLDLAAANGFGNNTVSVLLNDGDGFGVRRSYRTGKDPEAVAIGDLNGDHKPDLVTANHLGGNSVSVLFGIGDGRFQVRRDSAAGHGPEAVAIGDLNGDGKADLVTANESDSKGVSVFLNTGDGNFEPRRDYGAPFAIWVSIGDLNGDGSPDVAAVGSINDTLSILLNRGDGTFRAGRSGQVEPDPYSVALADLNGDGKLDLVSANSNREVGSSVSVLLNRGNATFRSKLYWWRGGGPLAIGDLNDDHRPELVTSGYRRGVSRVSLLVNTGSGTFEPQLDFRTGRRPTALAIGDLNGDGKPDLVSATSWSGSVSVLVSRPGLCTVQDVERQALTAAKRSLVRANCRVGRISQAYSSIVRRGRVISQQPRFGAVLPKGGKVNLVVSRGRRSS